jgi:hypothetical protein
MRVYCEVCGARGVVANRMGLNAFAHQHASHYSESGWGGAGDAVHEVAKAMGVQSCKPCEKRRRKMNRWFPRLFKR